MSHNLYGERFYSHRQKAWHNLGYVSDVPMSAIEAFNKVGSYAVNMRPVFYESEGVYVPVPDRQALVSSKGAIFDVVSKDYGLITPFQFFEAFDQSVKVPIETLGALGDGHTVFVSTKLPTFAVKGDEIESYLLAVNPMTGFEAALVAITNVRVVCQNTLNAAKESTQQKFRVVHDNKAVHRLAVWLEHAWGTANAQAQALKEAYEVLSNINIRPSQVIETVEGLYELPAFPYQKQADLRAHGADKEEIEAVEISYDRAKQNTAKHHRAVYNLYDGEGKGMDHESCKGTAFGLYNAVCEYEDWARPVRGIKDSVHESILFGTRAAVKEDAYSTLLQLA